MGLAPKLRTDLVSAGELPNIIDAAIKAAGSRAGGPTGKLVRKWEIVGKVARNFDQGHAFATDVAAALRTQGIDAQPAVLGVGKDIICGFIERGNLPQVREF